MKLKPVTFVNARYNKYRQNTTQQLLLLKALRVTQDPKKLKEMIGVRTVAEVFRTLDKLAIRKEYHKQLAKSGVDFGFIVNGIKQECLEAEKSADRLKGYQILLKSLGMDKYDDTSDSREGGWEEALHKIIDKKEKEDKMIEAPDQDLDDDDEYVEDDEYDVIQPSVPDSVKLKQQEMESETNGLYD